MSDNNSMPPDYIRRSLTEIIEYLWSDELKHMRSVASSGPKYYLGGHILADLMSVRAWIEPKYLPVEVKSQAVKLANYILRELGPCVPVTVRTAASQVQDWPGDTLAVQRLVDYLQRAIY